MAGRSNAKGVRIDGFWFGSGAEARRYQELRLMEAGGLISNLVVHPPFPIYVGGDEICTYVADFKYKKPNGNTVIEDVKGFPTEVFKLKRKLFEALYKTNLLVTPASDYRATAKRRKR